MRIIIFSIVGIVIITLLIFMTFRNNHHEEVRTSQATITTPMGQQMKVIGWIPNWDQDNAFQSYTQHSSKLQYVSVFWYRLDGNGNVTTYQATNEDPGIINLVHANHGKIFALVANLPDYNEHKDWDPDRVQNVISSEQARQNHISDLVTLVTSKNFDGLDIDYESLRVYQRDNFSIFIQELAAALHQKNKLLGIAVYPQNSTITPDQDYGVLAQNLPVLAQAADQLYFMTYLQHTLSSP